MQLGLEVSPHFVQIGHFLGLHDLTDVRVLGPAVHVDLVTAEMHDVSYFGEVQQFSIKTLEDLERVVVYGVELTAVRLAAVRGPRLLVDAQSQLAHAVFHSCSTRLSK